MKLGVHVSAAGGLDLTPSRAREIGCATWQVFVKSNRQWRARALGEGEAARFRTRRDTGCPVYAHASYLVNLAAADPAVRERSVHALRIELRRCAELGLDGLVVHPGAHLGAGVEAGLRRIVRSLRRVLDDDRHPPLLLEATAGQGTTLGSRLHELGYLLERTAPEQVGVCLDTCHLHAAGYRLDGARQVRDTLARIDDRIDWTRVHLLHLNDSRAAAGSRVDRHAGIGEGTIGRAGFRALLSHGRIRALPGILETPKGDGDELDRLNLTRLRALLHHRSWPRAAASGRSSVDAP